MKKQIFIINGSGGKGKDTFVELLSQEMYKIIGDQSSVVNFSYSYEPKKIAKLCGWDGVSKTENDRLFLSRLTDAMAEYNDLPYQSVVKMVNDFNNDEDGMVLFIHTREPKDIKRMVNDFGAKTILINSSRVDDITTNHVDRDVYKYKNYDCTLFNNGDLDDLRNDVKDFINNIIFKGEGYHEEQNERDDDVSEDCYNPNRFMVFCRKFGILRSTKK